MLQTMQPAVVLSDLRLPEGDGFGVLRAAKEIDADIPVIVMTAYGSIEDAVTAMKEGAMDFLAKPVDPDHLLLLVNRALEQRRIVTENLLLKEELAVRRGAPQLVGEDPSLRKVFASLQRAADDGRDRAARRGERHRQGAVRALAARAQPARRLAVCRDQLRRDSRKPPRDRALRLREGGVHRARRGASPASSRWRTGARCSSTRSATCRCRSRRRSCARSRRRSSSASAAPRCCRSTSGWWRRPTRACARPWRRGGSARISTSACRSFRSRSRRCAIVPATSRCWRATSSSGSAAI